MNKEQNPSKLVIFITLFFALLIGVVIGFQEVDTTKEVTQKTTSSADEISIEETPQSFPVFTAEK